MLLFVGPRELRLDRSQTEMMEKVLALIENLFSLTLTRRQSYKLDLVGKKSKLDLNSDNALS